MAELAAEDALAKLKAENEEMEKMIASLTSSKQPGGDTLPSFPASGSSSIKVLSFTTASANEAGKDLGSSWCPPQCSRRTVLGGFFTS